MLTFAYGSNLDEEQMRERCPTAISVGRAWLPDHRLVFSGLSPGWGGAVANAVMQAGSRLPGLIYQLTDADLQALDRYEGYPRLYRRAEVAVVDEAAVSRIAWIYLRATAEPPGEPSHEYLETIRDAYARLGFGSIEL